MKHTKTFLITALLAFVLAACGTTDSTNGQKGAEVGEGFPTVTGGETSNVNLPPELRNPTGALAVRSIYFDYDKFDVRSDSREVLAAHAKVLVNNPRLKMLVQGNTDDRGSSEYNLALGQKRAEAVFFLHDGRQKTHGQHRPKQQRLGLNGQRHAVQHRRGQVASFFQQIKA